VAKKTKSKSSLVNKAFSYKSPLSYFNPLSLQGFGVDRAIDAFTPYSGLLGLFKDGGRVRGCGVAKRGFGKAMKRKK